MGALAVTSVTYDVHDAAVRPLTADTSSAPTYGAWVDLPGIQQVQVNPTFITAELKGDAKVLDNRSKTSAMDISCNYAQSDLNVLKTVLGGTLTATATTKQSWVLLGTNSTPYIGFAFAVNDVTLGIGNILFNARKCKMTGGNLFDQQTDQYGARSLQMQAIATISNDQLIEIVYNSTVVTIATAFT